MDHTEYLYRLICAELNCDRLTEEEVMRVASLLQRCGSDPRNAAQLPVG